MNKYIKRLIIVFILLVLVKVILSGFILAPTQFADEYFYQRMGQSFFRQGEFLTDEMASLQYPPLYPMLVSPAFVFDDMRWVYFFMKVINSVISSTILFASFLLAKEFLSKRKAFSASILISVVPPMFGFFPYLMSENLFYPLFLFTIYFMYKSFVEKEFYWSILTGLFIGLCSLTKIYGLFLIIVYGLILFIKLIKEKNYLDFIKKGFLSGIVFLLVYGWWMLRDFLIFGRLFGTYNQDIINTGDKLSSNFVLPLLWKIDINIVYLILACGLIFFIYALLSRKDEKYSQFYILSWITIGIFLILISLFNYKISVVGRLIARYYAHLIPLIIIMGFVGFNKKFKNKFWIPLLSIMFFIAGFWFVRDRLVPANNMSLSYIEVLNLIFDFIYSNYLLIIFLVLVPLSLVLLKKFKLRTLVACTLVFFIFVNVLTFGMGFYNSNYRWYNQEPVQIGIWFNDYLLENHESIKDLIVVFDKRDESGVHRDEYDDKYSDYFSYVERPYNEVTGFWINAKVIRLRYNSDFDVKDADYIITPFEMDLELIKKGEKVYIYKI